MPYDPDETLHPAQPFDWGTPAQPLVIRCQCKLCCPRCDKRPPAGQKWCGPCWSGYHLWAEAKCGSPFHYDLLDGGCPCMAEEPFGDIDVGQ